MRTLNRIIILLFCVSLYAPVKAQSDKNGYHSLEWKREPLLVSRFSEGLLLKKPHAEYPRPQLEREEWLNLNGEWDFLHNGPAPDELPESFTERALVPSPTVAVTSCVEKESLKGWYGKSFEIPKKWKKKRVLVNFEAVGGHATVFVNGNKIGEHKGSFDRFSFDITDYLVRGTQRLLVHFDDSDPAIARGKPGKLPGIWQSVWLEPVSDNHIVSYRQTPDIDNSSVRFQVNTSREQSGLEFFARVYKGKDLVVEGRNGVESDLVLNIENARLWSPEDPFLYDLELEIRKGEKVLDKISGYFGMRKISIEKENGVPRIFLNNKLYYQIGLLDQGYWPESHLTPPSDEALRWEIEQAKKMGFNALRKHVKVEAARFYYWCDRLGMLVWQDLPHQKLFIKKVHDDEEAKAAQRSNLTKMINQLYNHPSIIMWVIFNEGWGQFEPEKMAGLAKDLDQSRLIDATSHVWENWATDLGILRYNYEIYDLHRYSRTLSLENENPEIPSVIGEFGGIGYYIEGHTEKHDKYRGYGPDATSGDELLDAYRDLVLQLVELRDQSCAERSHLYGNHGLDA